MIVDKFTLPDGTKHYQAFPKSTRELRRLFLVYGIDAWLTKVNGQHYHILFEGSGTHNTEAASVDSFTAKKWLEIARKHAPASHVFHDGYEKFAWWGNLDQYITKETLH